MCPHPHTEAQQRPGWVLATSFSTSIFSRGCEAMPSPPPPSVQGSGSSPSPSAKTKCTRCPLPPTPPRAPSHQSATHTCSHTRTCMLAHLTLPELTLGPCLHLQQVLAAHISNRFSWSQIPEGSRKQFHLRVPDDCPLPLPVMVVVAPRSFSPLSPFYPTETQGDAR